MTQHDRPDRRGSWLIPLVVAFLMAACGSPAATPSPSGKAASSSTSVPTVASSPAGTPAPGNGVLPTVGPVPSGALTASATEHVTPGPTETPEPVSSSSIAPVPPVPLPTPTAATALEGLILVRQTGDVWNDTYLLVVIAPDGSAVRPIGPSVAAAWTPDGASIHFATRDPACVPHLWTFTVDGGRRVPVSAALQAADYGFSWSPDGSQVAFVRYQHGMPRWSCGSGGGTYTPEELVADVIVMGADGQDQRVVVHTTWPTSLAWSPDGTRIAFMASQAPWTSAEHLIVDVRTGALTTLDPIQGGSVSWSPDGRSLAFVATTGTATNIGIARPDGTALRTLYGANGRATGMFAWSPDSSTIATYAQRRNAAGVVIGTALLALDVATGAVRDLGVRDGDTSVPLAWSPDGRWIAFVPEGTGASPPGPLTLVEVASGERVSFEVTSASSDWRPEWFAWQPCG